MKKETKKGVEGRSWFDHKWQETPLARNGNTQDNGGKNAKKLEHK